VKNKIIVITTYLSGVKLIFWFDSARLEKHENQCVENAGCSATGPVAEPLVNNQQRQVSEQTAHEDHLRNELAEDVEFLVKELAVEHGQADAKQHLDAKICTIRLSTRQLQR
jgi:hypothetical protein